MIDLTAPVENLWETPDFTHIDLYYHGRTSPLSSLVTDCLLIDLTGGAERIAVDDLPELSLIEPGFSVILKTGWERYRGTQQYADSPWIDKSLIYRLVKLRVSLVLVDSPGVYGGARGPEHNEIDQYLADHEAYAVENLVSVDQISESKFRLYCFPILMSARNNAPCRVVAD